MYIKLRGDIIDLLWKEIEKPFQHDITRTGRIQYTKDLNKNIFINCEFDDDEIEDIKIRKLAFEIEISEYKKKHNNTNDIPSHLVYEEPIPNIKLYVRQSFWVKDKYVCASGYRFEAEEEDLNVLLRQIYYMTDSFGEPKFEDTKKIEWDLLNKKKIIILLPKKTIREYYSFSILSGQTDFFDTSEVWKNGA